jgi:transcriptional regulator with XRE-family HTH domain
MRVLTMRENLKKARQDAGMTQQQMADRLDVSLRYYQMIEAGTRTGDFTLWDTLEDITGVHQRVLREIL